MDVMNKNSVICPETRLSNSKFKRELIEEHKKVTFNKDFFKKNSFILPSDMTYLQDE